VRQIIGEGGIMAVAWAVSSKAFEEWRTAQRQFYPADPYYFCLDRVLRQLIIGTHERPNDEGIAIYVDRDKGRERLAKELAEWHEDRLRQLPPRTYSINPQREISVTYGRSSFDYKPLQLADIIANGAYRTLASFLKTGTRPAWPTDLFVASPSISCTMLTTANQIDAELHSSVGD
jgi:hypothetical protein